MPYASPKTGTVLDQDWASIHSSPPWNDTDHPFVVENTFGSGRSIYCAALDAAFLTLIYSLMDEPPSYTAETHPAVWMSVFHQPENNRFLIGFLNYQSQLPAIPIESVPFTVRGVAGERFARLVSLPDESELAFTVDADGGLRGEVRELGVFAMVAAVYEGGS